MLDTLDNRDELKALKANFVLDGEVCYMVNGRPDFQKLQNNFSRQDKLHFYAFDLLWLNGHDLKDLPLIKRKELLKELLANTGLHIHYLEHIEKEGERFFQEIEEKDMEGIIAKRKTSNYHPGWRSSEWLKIKTIQRQEMVICGYIDSEKNDREFKSLLCSVQNAGRAQEQRLFSKEHGRTCTQWEIITCGGICVTKFPHLFLLPD